MADNNPFGSHAQTPQQRAFVLQQMQAANPSLHTKVTAYVHGLHTRYVAGELSWTQVRELRDAPRSSPGLHSPIW